MISNRDRAAQGVVVVAWFAACAILAVALCVLWQDCAGRADCRRDGGTWARPEGGEWQCVGGRARQVRP